MKKIIISLLTIFIVGGVASIAWLKVAEIESTLLSNVSVVNLEVNKGDTLYRIKQRLLPYADIDTLGFKMWLKLNPEYSRIKAGYYEISPKSSLTSVFSMLMQGEVTQVSITLLEGHTAAQWFSQLSKNEYITDDIQSESSLYSALMSIDNSFCKNDQEKLEGCLLPDTYLFEKNTTASQLLTRAFMAMRGEIAKAWEERFEGTPIATPYQALILASIIEKETAVESERKTISGVFVNRLKQKMRLQTDPAVIYGLGDKFNGDITRKDLRTPTPYNTRIIKGLPPTPIAMPSRASIIASVHPAITDAFYFVATGYGGHKFSTNLADHNKAVRAYLKKRQQSLEQP
jgi:UPF0755 protein